MKSPGAVPAVDKDGETGHSLKSVYFHRSNQTLSCQHVSTT